MASDQILQVIRRGDALGVRSAQEIIFDRIGIVAIGKLALPSMNASRDRSHVPERDLDGTFETVEIPIVA
jgi:hypothetical protein